MAMIEVDQEILNKLQEIAKPIGITSNGVLRQLLSSNNRKAYGERHTMGTGTKRASNLSFTNIQDALIPFIVKVLYDGGGKATKSFVENEIFNIFQFEFEKPYYHETVSHGVPRWKHNIAWAKERGKNLHGFFKGASESGRGIWELTDEGIAYYEHNRTSH